MLDNVKKELPKPIPIQTMASIKSLLVLAFREIFGTGYDEEIEELIESGEAIDIPGDFSVKTAHQVFYMRGLSSYLFNDAELGLYVFDMKKLLLSTNTSECSSSDKINKFGP